MSDTVAGPALGRTVRWVRPRLVAAGQALVLAVMSYVGGLSLFILCVLSIAFIPLFGVGVLLVPAVMAAVRLLTNERRRLAQQWSGVEIPVPYRPRPDFAPLGVVGCWQRCRWLLTDPATWRDMLWLFASPVNLVIGLLPAALIFYGAEGVVVAPALGWLIDSGYPYGLSFAVGSRQAVWLPVSQGLLLLPLGLALAPPMLRLHHEFARSLLGPTRQALNQRVQHLTETRSDVVDAQAAELRRIERDLHDGAQARLVALGMSLGMAEDLVAQDPAAAQSLLAEARTASRLALSELRDLVRGIHPPVLAERGLDGGVRALAMAIPLPVDVDVDLPARPQAPVESAAYFAVAEALTNVAKHSGANRAWVGLRHADGKLTISVGDDGIGGADPRDGTGLRGIERRLAAFDGILAVTSPVGGPTIVTMELPCELSSPKTSPSSGTA
jgi:signal transduction histidine kinase